LNPSKDLGKRQCFSLGNPGPQAKRQNPAISSLIRGSHSTSSIESNPALPGPFHRFSRVILSFPCALSSRMNKTDPMRPWHGSFGGTFMAKLRPDASRLPVTAGRTSSHWFLRGRGWALAVAGAVVIVSALLRPGDGPRPPARTKRPLRPVASLVEASPRESTATVDPVVNSCPKPAQSLAGQPDLERLVANMRAGNMRPEEWARPLSETEMEYIATELTKGGSHE
jgi:hypothetical protein